MNGSATSNPPPPAVEKKGGVFTLKQTLLLVAGIVVLGAGGLWVQEWWQVGRFMESTDDAFVKADTTTIASKVPGFIVSVAVTDNQQVHVGDLLALIDNRDYRAELAKAQASVDGEKAALANLDASSQLQVALIEEARSKTEATAAEMARAKADGIRALNLVSRNVVSRHDFEQADATATEARAEDEAAKAGLIAAQRQLDVINTQKKQVEAALSQSKAELDLAQLNLSYTEIRSPIDGVVGNRHIRVGDYATVGSQLLSLVPDHGLYVIANFKESQIAQMVPGQRVRIEADSLRGVTFDGRVESLAPATGAEFSLLPPENATGNYTKIVQRVPVRIKLEGEASALGRLRPGLSVLASVDQR